ncbi:hypothetical protein SAMN05444817_103105 [Corynebacterium appendicis CIP 107643]|uniref:Uncharacterized protein n=1 Tax=Corynebacterium appendicis CIP 107643 TaxID=1161099 RepID=A0A1N7J0Y2_9CORY|nr:hypothetical protein [Corynebacterium appendicis]WJY61467.1 hypothetical protein CAPP_07780 [Corynebacterium appendicis CIP 107643]SIS43025.1 hypothetical protein SAMN05444817_103105 [Corynebacterium appendicis CIP 107643]
MKKRNTFLAAMLSAAMAFSAAPAAVAETAKDESATIADADNTNNEPDTGTDATDTEDGEEEDSEGLEPTKDIWDKGGASSDPAPNGPFKSDGLNRLSAYLNSNHFETVSAIVEVIAGVITVGSQLAAIIITVSPTAKAQFEAFMKQFS